MALTMQAVENAKPKDKPYKLADGNLRGDRDSGAGYGRIRPGYGNR